MVATLNYYMDESGTRHPDAKQGRAAAHGHDWFAFGGVLVKSEDEAEARELHAKFCAAWGITYPLHSVEIRGKTENFAWLKSLDKDEQLRFYEELYCLMRNVPVIGLACVIDRPGYNARYAERYKGDRWALCKTAFNIGVERAAKHAAADGRRVRVYCEECNKTEDRLAKGYIHDLKTLGQPFNPATSGKYRPLAQSDFSTLLYDFKTKKKSSPMIQLADLYLWPLCMGGYPRENRTYARLLDDEKLIECHIGLEDVEQCGTKYSCFELEHCDK